MSFSRMRSVMFQKAATVMATFAMVLVFALPGSGVAVAAPASTGGRLPAGSACTSGAYGVGLIGFSDALDKQSFAGTDVGGLSALTHDRHRGVYYALVDNERQTPARFYTLLLVSDDNFNDSQVTRLISLDAKLRLAKGGNR